MRGLIQGNANKMFQICILVPKWLGKILLVLHKKRLEKSTTWVMSDRGFICRKTKQTNCYYTNMTDPGQ